MNLHQPLPNPNYLSSLLCNPTIVSLLTMVTAYENQKKQINKWIKKMNKWEKTKKVTQHCILGIQQCGYTDGDGLTILLRHPQWKLNDNSTYLGIEETGLNNWNRRADEVTCFACGGQIGNWSNIPNIDTIPSMEWQLWTDPLIPFQLSYRLCTRKSTFSKWPQSKEVLFLV